MSNLKEALKYLEKGYYVIPVRRENKKPYIEWKQYQQESPMKDEVEDWWTKWPEANIGVITGKATNLVVIDVDDENGRRTMDTLAPGLKPHTISPHGLHFWFKYHEGMVNRAKIIPGIDVRTDGGYIIAPPGSNGDGGKYRKSLVGKVYDEIPQALYKKLKEDKSQSFKKRSASVELFKSGTRDEDLFRLANHLIKGGMDLDTAYDYLIFCARKCDPPFPENELKAKIESAIKRQDTRERNVSQETREYVASIQGVFTASECHSEIGNKTKEEKKCTRSELSRLIDVGIIEKHGNKNGTFRKRADNPDKIDIYDIDRKAINLWYPLNLHEYFYTQPKNIIIFAGTPDAGKTAFLMRTAIMNVGCGLPIRYMSSEMGASEFSSRAELFADVDYKEWKTIDIIDANADYQDHILPDGLNIVDYLEITDNFYLIGEALKGIYARLNSGIAIVGLQKGWNTPFGRGGSFSLEKPRLYVTLTSNPPEGNLAKIEKIKNWKTPTSMKGKSCHFTIRNGNQINRATEWEYQK